MTKDTRQDVFQTDFELENKSTLDLFDVSNRVVIVTGSNRGNGFAIANGLSNAGAKVVRIDLGFDNKLNTDDIEFDLSAQTQIKSLVTGIANKYGHIDALVNNAGVSIASENPYADEASYEKTLSINLHAAFAMCSAVCPIWQVKKLAQS